MKKFETEVRLNREMSLMDVTLHVVRQVVIIGFVTILVISGALMIILTVIGGKDFIRKMKGPSKEK
jgi:hypothetical protein